MVVENAEDCCLGKCNCGGRGKKIQPTFTHTNEILATGSYAKSQNKKCNSGSSPLQGAGLPLTATEMVVFSPTR